MISYAISMLLAGAAVEQTTLPRQPDSAPVEQQRTRTGKPTDPLFDRALVATDDPTFIVAALENSRQGSIEAAKARELLQLPQLREAAVKIGAANDSATRSLEAIAKRKGWRLPVSNTQRVATLAASPRVRVNADFIIGQLSWHQATIDQYRAQIAGKGDPELKRVLRAALPHYEQNRDLLLQLKP
jgi:hypothetical protein